MKGQSLVLSLFLVTVASQSCYFDFEEDTELQNFKLDCNGQIGEWIIKERNTNGEQAPPEAGDKVLTVKNRQASSCLESIQKIEVNENQVISVDYFRLKPQESDSYNLDVHLNCDTGSYAWPLLDGTEKQNNGQWATVLYTYTMPKSLCQLEIRLYIGFGTAEIEIDRVVLKDLPTSNECYVVPKPGTTTVPTTESTTSMTESTTESSSTETTTSLTTTESTTPSTESTTTSTTTEPTTTSTTSSTTSSTDLTTELTTSSTKQTTSSTTELTATPSIPPTPSMTNKPTSTDPSTTLTTESTSNDSEAPSTTNSPQPVSYPEFAMFYFVIIIASSGSVILLTIFATWLILRKRNGKKDHHLS